LARRYVDMPGQKLTPQILQTNGNPNDNKGTGGTCFGDSGGPVFLDGEIVAVTSYGYTDNCRYLGGYQRVDIPVVQDWLEGFGLKF
ncbi:MAG TPA: trypsin-like serine protease, partial [Marmoricola sp.]|nr:trypsin-like serine protease [Marmoricola sp.]